MKYYFFLFAVMLSLPAFAQKTVDKELIIKEIIAVEKQFQDDLNKIGIAEAFYKYAAPDAVIRRDKDTIIKGPEGIRNFYAKSPKGIVAEWKPDYVGVSDDGTMAYTYGKYIFTITQKDGKVTKLEGGIHTVWRRQKDGSWKYVWD